MSNRLFSDFYGRKFTELRYCECHIVAFVFTLPGNWKDVFVVNQSLVILLYLEIIFYHNQCLPWDGLCPNIPLKKAGSLMLPPRSEPRPINEAADAIKAPSPPIFREKCTLQHQFGKSQILTCLKYSKRFRNFLFLKDSTRYAQWKGNYTTVILMVFFFIIYRLF